MTTKEARLYGGNMSAATLQQTEKSTRNTLGLLRFSKSMMASDSPGDAPCVHVPMQNLIDGDEAVYEVWQSGHSLTSGQAGQIHYQFDDEVMFGVMQIDESAFTASSDKTALQKATETAYKDIFSLIETAGYPHVFRFWNYIADINQERDGLERYRQFNIGRHDAFIAAHQTLTGQVPAACALGYEQQDQSSLIIVFLAGKSRPLAIENPRQMSAYQYPQQYGPVSPTFSRAALVSLAHSQVLLISGTASIVGHETKHEADVRIQTRETMVNIEAILQEANRLQPALNIHLSDLHYRVYIRHPETVQQVQDALTQYIGKPAQAVYLKADICRRNLLLEIEATAECSSITLPQAIEA